MNKFVFLVLISVALLAGCDNDVGKSADKQSNGQQSDRLAKTLQGGYHYYGKAASKEALLALSAPAHLSKMLPAGTLAYIRIPHLFGFMSSPKGNLLDKILKDSQHLETMLKLREAVHAVLLKQKISSKFISLFVYHTRAPIEIALVKSVAKGANQAPFPLVIVHTKTDFKTPESLNKFINSLSTEAKKIKLLKPVDSHGKGMLKIGAETQYLYFKANTGRLTVIAGAIPDQAFADTTMENLKASTHPMHKMEKQIDTSGKGFFMFTDFKGIITDLDAFVPPHLKQLRMMTVFINKIAIGWGVSNGKSRIKYILDSNYNIETYLGVLGNDFNLNAAGDPDFLFSLALPSPGNWSGIRSTLQSLPAKNNFAKVMASFKEATGITVTEILESVGPKLGILYDKAGEYLFLQIRDQGKFKKLISTLSSANKLMYKTTKMGDVLVHKLEIQLIPKAEKKSLAELPFPLHLLLKRKIYLYWVEEGDYLVMSGVPQMLTDRIHYKTKTDIGSWLVKRQRQNFKNASMLLSTTITGSTRSAYYMYLGAIQVLGDMFDYPIDLTTFPSAGDLNFAIEGTYGFQIDLNQNGISAELVFENNPLEFMFTGRNLGMIAMTGVVAAIAIPAYNDYIKRAKVQRGLQAARLQKRKVIAYYQTNKKFPDAEAIKNMGSGDLLSSSIQKVIVEADTGRISVSFVPGLLWDGKLLLTPTVGSAGDLSWQCSSNLPHKYSPAECKRYLNR